MIDWIHELCQKWGDARSRIDYGRSNTTSIWGRIKEGWSIASAKGSKRPEPLEVMGEEALSVSVAIRRAIDSGQLREREYWLLYVHYVERAPAKRKAYVLNISRKRYYEILHRCHRVLKRNIEEQSASNQDDACQGDKTVGKYVLECVT